MLKTLLLLMKSYLMLACNQNMADHQLVNEYRKFLLTLDLKIFIFLAQYKARNIFIQETRLCL
jgi:hypothetical protein